MLNLRPNHLISVAVLTLASFQAAAQAYYPYNTAEYADSVDYGQPVYGYPQAAHDNYYQPQSGGYTYDQGGNYYSGQNYPAQTYDQAPAQSYPQAPAYGYDQGAAQGGYSQAYAPQQYTYPQSQAYAQQQYAYPQQAYQGQPYYYPYPRNNKDAMRKIIDPEKWRGRNFGEEFWPGDDSIYEDVLPVHGPWDRNWGKAPWNRPYEDLWGDEGGPDAWMDFSDPKEGLAWMWEDFLYTPNALGTMPGGWEAPTISVPNPVDVGDEFKDASTDFPGEMKDFADGFTYGDRTITGSKPSSDGGSFGMGSNKKKDGINIQPKQR